MPNQMTTEQAIGKFRFQQGKMAELRELFADCAAAAMMVDGDEALEELSHVLRDVLAAPLRNLDRGTFDDMRPWHQHGAFDDMRHWKTKSKKENYHV